MKPVGRVPPLVCTLRGSEVRPSMIERPTPPAIAAAEPGPTGSGGPSFGEWLGAQLKARRLTQRQLAGKSGVDHSTISRLVRSDRVPSWTTANRLVRSLGIAEGPAGISHQGPGNTENPAARVEHALRLDDLLSESQVRDIMNVYLAARLRRPRLVTTPGSATTETAHPPRFDGVPGASDRSPSIRRLPTAARRRSS
jgi:transcriptional regulator with XRE-family HTH domain